MLAAAYHGLCWHFVWRSDALSLASLRLKAVLPRADATGQLEILLLTMSLLQTLDCGALQMLRGCMDLLSSPSLEVLLKASLYKCAEASGKEMTSMTKSAPASRATSRSSTRPSSPMPAPQAFASAMDAEQPVISPAASSGAAAGHPSKSVKFSKSMPKDLAHLTSRYESGSLSIGHV